MILGLLRSPTRGKPAHHKKACSPKKSRFTTKKSAHQKKAGSPQKSLLTTKKSPLTRKMRALATRGLFISAYARTP
jgi:hypothetical protein